jgi:hypothetical protein
MRTEAMTMKLAVTDAWEKRMTSVTLENLSEEKNSYDKKLGNARRLSL